MLKKFKHMLGIEGAKVSVFLDSDAHVESGHLKGQVELISMTKVAISSIALKVEERYQRGRGKGKLVDKYTLVEKDIPVRLELAPDMPVLVPFDIRFDRIPAPIDEFASRGFFNKAVAWAAKRIKNAESSYLLTVEAIVEGTKLNPFDTLEILKE